MTAARSHLCLALDEENLDDALRLADAVGSEFAVAKVGLELYGAVGPDAVRALVDRGFDVFVDLKLHDIPTTVRRAARVLAHLRVRYVTVHTVGGAAMLEAAVAGLVEGAHDAGVPVPIGLGVTVLTSEAAPPTDVLEARAQVAATAGLGGIVCAAPDLAVVRAAAPRLRTMVPGTRPKWASIDDQVRVETPGDAIRHGADVLVIGRVVSAAADPVRAARAISNDVNDALREVHTATP